MAEFNPQDELLKRWAEGCHTSVLSEVNRIWRNHRAQQQLDPLDVYLGLEQALRSGHCESPASVRSASFRLRSLILAELSGARRARERATQIIVENSHDIDLLAHGNTRAAQKILEAFDGE